MFNIIEIFFPLIANNKTNKKIREKLNQEDYSALEKNLLTNNEIPLEEYKYKYNESLKVRDSLEDKAKNNIIGVTVATTLITGSASFFDENSYSYFNNWVNWIVFLLVIFSIFYMASAGVIALKVLVEENQISVIPIDAFKKGKILELKTEYEISTNYNENMNVIRNNYIFSSYLCIRNSFICLIAITIMLNMPISLGAQDSKIGKQEEPYSFFIISENNQLDKVHTRKKVIVDLVNKDISDRLIIETGEKYSFYDSQNGLYVTYSLNGEVITLESIKRISFN